MLGPRSYGDLFLQKHIAKLIEYWKKGADVEQNMTHEKSKRANLINDVRALNLPTTALPI